MSRDVGRIILRGKNRDTLGKASPSVTLFTTDFTWSVPGSNPGLCDERPASNRLKYSATAFIELTVPHSKHCVFIRKSRPVVLW